MWTLRVLACLLILGGVAAACASAPTPEESPLSTRSPLATPLAGEEAGGPPKPSVEPPVPETGKASVSGVLYTFTGGGPVPGTVFYLTPGRGENHTSPPSILVGPRDESGDVRGLSGAQGEIVVNNIPPGSYYLAAWAPYDWILAVESNVDMTPRLIGLQPNQRLELGIVYVPWP